MPFTYLPRLWIYAALAVAMLTLLLGWAVLTRSSREQELGHRWAEQDRYLFNESGERIGGVTIRELQLQRAGPNDFGLTPYTYSFFLSATVWDRRDRPTHFHTLRLILSSEARDVIGVIEEATGLYEQMERRDGIVHLRGRPYYCEVRVGP